MFTRVVELTTKAGRAKEVTSVVHDKVLPILQKQPGFVDEIVLISDTEPNRILALSFWASPSDAERYNREQYPTVDEILRPFLENAPTVRTFHVETSTTHKIAAGKAA